MSFIEDDDEDAPASTIVRTSLGGVFDIKNISGRMKKQLTDSGEVSHDAFVAPDNMPGKMLAQLRAEADTRRAKEVAKQFKIGDIVTYRKGNYEVLKVHSKKGVKIRTKKNEVSGWLSFSEVKLFTNTEDVEDA